MKTLLRAFLLLAFLAVLPGGAEAQRKYGLKSGIITFENKITILGKEVPQKAVLYFDDYGMRERKELYESDVLQEAYLCDGKELFNLVFEESTAYRAGASSEGTEPRFDGDSLKAKVKGKGSIKELPVMTVAGKACEAYETAEGGATTTLAGWKHITLYTRNSASGIHSSSKAVKIVENATIPPEKFAVPAGFTTK